MYCEKRKLAISGSSDGRVKLFDMNRFTLLKTIKVKNQDVSFLCCDSEELFFAFVDNKNLIYIYSLITGEKIAECNFVSDTEIVFLSFIVSPILADQVCLIIVTKDKGVFMLSQKSLLSLKLDEEISGSINKKSNFSTNKLIENSRLAFNEILMINLSSDQKSMRTSEFIRYKKIEKLQKEEKKKKESVDFEKTDNFHFIKNNKSNKKTNELIFNNYEEMIFDDEENLIEKNDSENDESIKIFRNLHVENIKSDFVSIKSNEKIKKIEDLPVWANFTITKSLFCDLTKTESDRFCKIISAEFIQDSFCIVALTEANTFLEWDLKNYSPSRSKTITPTFYNLGEFNKFETFDLINDKNGFLFFSKTHHSFFTKTTGGSYESVFEERYKKINMNTKERHQVSSSNQCYTMVVVNMIDRNNKENEEISMMSCEVYIYFRQSHHRISLRFLISKPLEKNECKNNIYVISCSKQNPELFFTGDSDGNLIVWDVSIGQHLFCFKENCEQIDLFGISNPILDLKLIENDTQILVSTFFGTVSLFSFGAPEKFQMVPCEQFLMDDYLPYNEQSETIDFIKNEEEFEENSKNRYRRYLDDSEQNLEFKTGQNDFIWEFNKQTNVQNESIFIHENQQKEKQTQLENEENKQHQDSENSNDFEKNKMLELEQTKQKNELDFLNGIQKNIFSIEKSKIEPDFLIFEFTDRDKVDQISTPQFLQQNYQKKQNEEITKIEKPNNFKNKTNGIMDVKYASKETKSSYYSVGFENQINQKQEYPQIQLPLNQIDLFEKQNHLIFVSSDKKTLFNHQYHPYEVPEFDKFESIKIFNETMLTLMLQNEAKKNLNVKNELQVLIEQDLTLFHQSQYSKYQILEEHKLPFLIYNSQLINKIKKNKSIQTDSRDHFDLMKQFNLNSQLRNPEFSHAPKRKTKKLNDSFLNTKQNQSDDEEVSFENQKQFLKENDFTSKRKTSGNFSHFLIEEHDNSGTNRHKKIPAELDFGKQNLNKCFYCEKESVCQNCQICFITACNTCQLKFYTNCFNQSLCIVCFLKENQAICEQKKPSISSAIYLKCNRNYANVCSNVPFTEFNSLLYSAAKIDCCYFFIPDAFGLFIDYFKHVINCENLIDSLNVLLKTKSDFIVKIKDFKYKMPLLLNKNEFGKYYNREENNYFVFQNLEIEVVSQNCELFGKKLKIPFCFPNSLDILYLIPEEVYPKYSTLFHKLKIREVVKINKSKYIVKSKIREIKSLHNSIEIIDIETSLETRNNHNESVPLTISPWDIDGNEEEKLIDFSNSDVFFNKSVANEIKKQINKFCNRNVEKYIYFIKEVDKEGYPDYLNFVPVECYIDMILNKIENCYYTKVSQILKDFELIEINAKLYNPEKSPVIQYAKELHEEAIKSIKNIDESDRRVSLRRLNKIGERLGE